MFQLNISFMHCMQVEAGHDLDIADITTRITAPSIFVRLLLSR